MKQSGEQSQGFRCDDSGYIRHWLITDVRVTPYDGPSASENQIRARIADPVTMEAPRAAEPGAESPWGTHWHYYSPGQNIFVEQSGFYHELSKLDMFAVTDVLSAQEITVTVRLWACGTGDFWLNGELVCRHDVPKYMYPEPTQVPLKLKAGKNELAARVQALGVRDTRFLFGVQVLESSGSLSVQLPGSPEITAELSEAEAWLATVRADGRDSLAAAAASFNSTVKLRGKQLTWAKGQQRVQFAPEGQDRLSVGVRLHGQQLSRELEIPANRKIRVSDEKSVESHRHQATTHISENMGRSRSGVMPVLARHTLGQRGPEDEAILSEALDWIDGRPDCADFPLAAILRLYLGDSLTERERKRARRTVLNFRYWTDEPGNDAMCFESENHSLLFHGCQLIAGKLFPDEVFTNSDRTGREQAKIGKQRCQRWVEQVEKHGFREFLSSTYMPLTAAALLNVVDFSGDDELSQRASHILDGIFDLLAMHSFDGVTIGPQGRVYRGVLYPDSSGTQAMMSYAATEAVVASNDWLSFVAASPNYRMPDSIRAHMKEPISRCYRQANVEIQLEKTADYLLTSLQIPTSSQRSRPASAPPQSGRAVYPGLPGYQQHLWQATLARDCHVFVNHPGASYDLSSSRPGFWYGNGVIPRTFQQGGMLCQVFDIPEEHPIHFTHAHWPTDAFDQQEIHTYWAFGTRDAGGIGLWCSEPMALHSDVLTDRELRAQGRHVAWLAYCVGEGQVGSIDALRNACIALQPRFDVDAGTLTVQGQEVLSWEV